MNFNNKIIKLLTKNDITFVHTLPKFIKIEKLEKIYYHQSKIFLDNMGIMGINNFLNNLEENKIFVISVLLSKTGSYNDPYVSLTREFLVSSYSNEFIIKNLIEKQIDHFLLNFIIDTEGIYQLVIRYREVNMIESNKQ